jgi:putative PIN family toxin of toxin-antitoxin system
VQRGGMPDHKIRVVLDTNVLVSGLTTHDGPSVQIINAVQAEDLQVVISLAIIEEFNEVIIRPNLLQKYPEVSQFVDDLLDFLRANAILVEGKPENPLILDDPDDDFVVACAIDGQADYIVSGDSHLLELGQYLGIAIMNPRQFVDKVLI